MTSSLAEVSGSRGFLGRVLPFPDHAVTGCAWGVLMSYGSRQSLEKDVVVRLYIASESDQNLQASIDAVSRFVQEILSRIPVIESEKHEVASDMPNQPMGVSQTERGSRNRLENLIAKVRVITGIDPTKVKDSVVRIFVALQNGILVEPEETYVDRSFVTVRVCFDGESTDCTAISQGVMVPKQCVEKSQDSGFKKTVGEFIEEIPEFPHHSLRAAMDGLEHKVIIEETILAALRGYVRR